MRRLVFDPRPLAAGGGRWDTGESCETFVPSGRVLVTAGEIDGLGSARQRMVQA